MVGSVYRSGQILDLFDASRPEWGVSAVARTIGVSRSSAHGLLHTMTAVGLLRQTSGSQFRLGWRILHLSQVLLEGTEFRSEARSAMEDLAARYHETVHLAVLEESEVVYVDKIQGTQPVQVSITRIGGRLPARCTGVGKALLAHRPWGEVLLRLKGSPSPATASNVQSLERLRDELNSVDAQGYALDEEETLADLCCIAAPILDHNDEAVAAMSLSIPAFRFYRNREMYRSAIIGACQQVSRNLGSRTRAAPGMPARPQRTGQRRL
jgi:IclR family KDG regulon transcriptional repressor